MKASSAISARATAAQPPIARSSARPPSPTSVESFALSGPSERPDPLFNAYRRDLADVALTGRVIASHYADPVERLVATPAVLRASASDTAESLADLKPGDPFLLLDDSLGWAWGYAGEERRVGYIRSDSVRNA